MTDWIEYVNFKFLAAAAHTHTFAILPNPTLVDIYICTFVIVLVAWGL